MENLLFFRLLLSFDGFLHFADRTTLIASFLIGLK